MGKATKLALMLLLLGGCDKPPEKPKKPQRYTAETQKTQTTPQYSVTIWNQKEVALVGTNVFGLEFMTPDKKLVDPGPISILPFLEDVTKETMPGQAAVKATDTPGVFDVVAELPSTGRWRFNVMVAGQAVKFYYTVRASTAPYGKDRSGEDFRPPAPAK